MDNIEINGYRLFKNLSVQLRSVNLLIDANGAGKSNSNDFLNFLDTVWKVWGCVRNNIPTFLKNSPDVFIKKSRCFWQCIMTGSTQDARKWILSLLKCKRGCVISYIGNCTYDTPPIYKYKHIAYKYVIFDLGI